MWKFLQPAVAVAGLVLASLSVAQDAGTLNRPAAPATGTAAVTGDPRQPESDRRAPPVRDPEAVSLPRQAPERSVLQPGPDSRALVGGQWVSPQWLLGRAADLPRAQEREARSPSLASEGFQPRSEPLAEARGLDERVVPSMVTRYSEAPVVRFVASEEAMVNLLEGLSLDDLNRYQFRRNRPEGIPVERPKAETR